MCSMLSAMMAVNPKTFPARVKKYSDKIYPERVRCAAEALYIAKTDADASIAFAREALSENWRTSNEHGHLRMALMRSASSASPSDREKYVEFFKWGGTNAPLGGLIKTWDKNTIELDPTWRTNSLRRISAEYQRQYAAPNEIASNNVLPVIRDYEIASGIRQSEPPPPVSTQTPQTNIATAPVAANVVTQTNTNAEAVVVAVVSNVAAAAEKDIPTSVTNTKKHAWILGAFVLLAPLVLAAFLKRKR